MVTQFLATVLDGVSICNVWIIIVYSKLYENIIQPQNENSRRIWKTEVIMAMGGRELEDENLQDMSQC